MHICMHTTCFCLFLEKLQTELGRQESSIWVRECTCGVSCKISLYIQRVFLLRVTCMLTVLYMYAYFNMTVTYMLGTCSMSV